MIELRKEYDPEADTVFKVEGCIAHVVGPNVSYSAESKSTAWLTRGLSRNLGGLSLSAEA